MAIWGPDAEMLPAPEAAPPASRKALRWYDILLLPLGALAAALLVACAALAGDWLINAPPGISFRFWADGTASTVWFSFLLQYALYLGLFLTGVLLVRLRGFSLGEVYFPRIRWRSFLASGGLGAIFAGLFMLLLSLLPAETQRELMEQSELLSPGSGGAALALLVLAVFLAPIAEELYFRGVMFRLLSERVPFLVSGGLTAALFSLSHGHLFVLPGLGGSVLTALLFAIGFVFAVLARLTGSLRPSTIMHAVYNAVLIGPGVVAIIAGAAA